jgi:hypothetical protein
MSIKTTTYAIEIEGQSWHQFHQYQQNEQTPLTLKDHDI